MSLIMPNGSRTIPLQQRGGATNQVNLKQPTNPYQFTPQQTGASYNYARAQAVQGADPRYSAKKYQKAGMSSSKGTDYLGAGEAANAYATGMANAEAQRMQDAYSNANMQLADQVERDRYSNALIGLQEQNAQANWMNDFQSMNNAMGFMGDMAKTGGGMFGNVLGGLGKMGSMDPMGFMNQGQNLLTGLL